MSSVVTCVGAVRITDLLRSVEGPVGVSYSSTCSSRVPSQLIFLSFHCRRGGAPALLTWSASASANCTRPLLKEPTVWPRISGKRGSRGGFSSCSLAFSWKSLMAPATREPPIFSRICTRPVADSAESLLGSPAYTPLTKGSIRRWKASSPRLRVTNSLTLSSRSGIGSLKRPMAPRPARILPGHERKSPKTASAGVAGRARSWPSHQTKR
mmetsp:Transcript_568/g.1588  ORF Transcript_568/g.1588 Transcript_568/m.1588 type:complete len:211 (+) Transcript_568:660-1292(+)